MKPLLVVNPRSGGGTTARTFSAMRTAIERALGPVEIAMTDRQGHGVELARDGALAGHPLVIAVGGDGTLHEVVNGLMAARELHGVRGGNGANATELGIIALGTGGDFRKTLGIDHRLDKYLEAIASGRTRALDVGRFTGGGKAAHYFVNVLSAGMGGLVDRYIADSSRAFGPTIAYFGAAARALINVRLGNIVCNVTRAGATEEHRIRSYMIAVCNGRYFGSGMHVAPMAAIDDGALDLIALGATSKAGLAFTAGSSIYKGTHVRQPSTVHIRGEKFSLEIANDDARSAYLLDVDGEPLGSLPVSVEVVPRALVLRA
ncbi:MAG: diacylglycerol kinase family lipid kinase [Polyangiaceae bacterium]|nr:diacylglycerol kinase family lipid kinase [Polyangiaceae bacterium]